jgi:hypothetical protein
MSPPVRGAPLAARFDAWFDATGSLRGPCLFRVFAGPLVIVHLWPYLQQMLRGEYYGSSFYVPWLPGYPEAPRALYHAILCTGVLSAAAMTIGLYTRVATRWTFAVVAYNFFLSETFFHHNRAFLLIFLAGLSLIDAGRSVSIDALRRGAEGEPAPLWPLWLWRAEACVPYLASSVSKLIDPDWRGGIVTWDRVLRYRHHADALLPPQWVDLVATADFHAIFAKLVIATELAVGIGLWIPRARYLAVWLAVVFHALIQVTAEIQVFSLLGIAGLLIWATPRTRDRRLVVRIDTPEGLRLARTVCALDWLARFELQVERGEGASVVLTEPDGRRFEGEPARLRALGRLPLLAFFFLPRIGWDPARVRSSSPATAEHR